MAVKCPKCQSDNTDTARFCSNCATALIQPGQPPAPLTKTLESPAYVLTKGSLVAGKYRIHEELGRGGMGVVYKAEDMKLARKVAIKVLPEIFTTDPERLARFEREARVLASLNHPNIAAIYGVEEAEGKRFLVLELVEGETLAERLSKGPLPLEETLEVCRQIAEGLEGAHEKGIIHRDLKPSNVKITSERKVKILDFGLAKAFHDQVSEVDLSKSPTITAEMTQPGVILGTAAYMSPEQATGRQVDKRSDIWAFGCILYECLAGKRAFPGTTVTESLAAILRGEPEWASLPAGTPGNVRSVLRRCLQKDANRRLRDIGDARLEIEEPEAYPAEAVIAHRRYSLPLLGACAVVILVAGIIIGSALIRYIRPPHAPSVLTTTIKVEPGFRLAGGTLSPIGIPTRTAVVISSDSKFIIYSAIEQQPGSQAVARLFLRRLDRSEAKPIAGTDGGISPFLAPDDRWVGFWADGKLKKVLVDGGVPATLCDADSFGASWGPGGIIVFAEREDSGLSRVSADGGTAERLTSPDPKREANCHRLPSWLPDGKAVLFTVMRYNVDSQPRLALLDLDTREWRELLPDAADARYVPTGHLVFLRQGTLMAVRFDAVRRQVIGQPLPVVGNVIQAIFPWGGLNTGAGQYGVSDSGSLVYAAGGVLPDMQNSLVWVDQRGLEQEITPLRMPFQAPRLSPDGLRIAYVTRGKEWQVFVHDLNSGTNNRLTNEGMSSRVIWTPDAKRVVFMRQESSSAAGLFSQPYDGSSPVERLTTSEYEQFPGSWSSDGKTVALAEVRPDTGYDIALLDARSGRVTPFLNSQFNERFPELSPDGRWIAYVSDDSGRDEVYVRPFPGPGMKRLVSTEGGVQPLWARNGKQLFFRWEDQVWTVDVRTDGGLSTGKPRLLFERSGYSPGDPTRSYDLSFNGQRFLMVKLEQRKPAPATEIVFVQNWFEELKRLVPTGKE